MKCDEAKPNCYRCTSNGRKCLGYNASPEVSDKHTSPELRKDISISFAGTDAERRAFGFYYARTSWCVAGSQDHDFWRDLIPKRVHVDVGIRHAVLALASFYEDFESGADHRGSDNTFALKQYNLAIKEHVDLFHRESGPATAEAYLPCLVFVCIEVIYPVCTLCLSVSTHNVIDVTKQFYFSSVFGKEVRRPAPRLHHEK